MPSNSDVIWRSLTLFVACGVGLGCGGKYEIDAIGSASGGAGASAGSNAGASSAGASSAECGPSCKGTCRYDRCVVTLASPNTNVACLAVDATSVYWAEANLGVSGAISRAAISGGPPSTLATTTNAPWPCSLAVDSMFVYWADGSSGSLFKARTRGSVVASLASLVGADFVAIDATNLYSNGQFGYPTKVPLSGGAPVRLADAYGAEGAAIDDTNMYWTVRGPGIGNGSIQKVPLSGGTPTTLVSGQDLPQGIATDGVSVFWTNYNGGTVQKVPRDGGPIVTLSALQFNPTVIAVDEVNAYWSQNGAGSLVKAAKGGGGQVIMLADSQALALAVDATSLYWTDGTKIMKLTPKF